MSRAAKIVLGASVALILTGVARAGVTLNAARVGAVDVAALAKFYEAAFGLEEVNRLQLPGSIEIMMNFGDSAAAAKANKDAQVVIMHRNSNDLKDPVPHLVFNVTDIAAVQAAITKAGGSMKPARAFGNTGIMIGIATDPAGNLIELIQPAKR
jgi:predicted enzyme related to lactoylglutathione lyase